MTNEEHDQILSGDHSFQSFSERHFGLTTSKFFILLGVVTTLIIYFGILAFGNNSLSILFQLEEHQEFLSDDIEHLKAENAALQKQYFELKELDTDIQPNQNGDTP